MGQRDRDRVEDKPDRSGGPVGGGKPKGATMQSCVECSGPPCALAVLHTAGFVTEAAQMLTGNHLSDPRAGVSHRVLIDLIVTTFSGAITPDHKAGGKSLCVVSFFPCPRGDKLGIDSGSWLSGSLCPLGDGLHFQLCFQ